MSKEGNKQVYNHFHEIDRESTSCQKTPHTVPEHSSASRGALSWWAI